MRPLRRNANANALLRLQFVLLRKRTTHFARNISLIPELIGENNNQPPIHNMPLNAALFRFTPLWWGLVCTLPLISGLLGRLIKQKPWFVDFDAIACAGMTLSQGGNPYSLSPACEGMHPAVFVYAPVIAESLSAVVAFMGLEGFRVIYVLLWLAALTGIGLYVWKSNDQDWRLKLPVFALLTGGSLASGNIALLLHGLILAAALSLPKRVSPFIIAVTMAALIKPTLLTYLIVLVYLDKPLRWRIGTLVTGSLTGLAGYALISTGTGDLHTHWHTALDQVVLSQQPGISFFSWIDATGLNHTGLPSLIGLVLFMIILSLSGLALAELGKAGPAGRLAIGLGMAQLLNPRLMDYDLLLVIPLLVTAVSLSQATGQSWARYSLMTLNGLMASVLILNMLDAPPVMPVPLGVLGISLMVIVQAGALALKRLEFPAYLKPAFYAQKPSDS